MLRRRGIVFAVYAALRRGVVAPLEEVVETAGAEDVADDAVYRRPLRDRHLGLRDRTVAFDLDGAAAEEVEDADAALEALATVSGADRAVKNAIPIIDDFRFGSAYSPLTGRTEPQVTVGKRITDDVRANVTTGLTEDRELIANIEWRLGKRVSAQASYDNLNTVTASATGNVGLDLRWRLEFK